MDPKDKAVEVYLEEYRALRREVEGNLTAEGNAIKWSIGLLTGLLTFLGSGNPPVMPDFKVTPHFKGLILAVAPLMFTALYMMLCKRHRNSRRISRYVVIELSERLRQLEIPDALLWDISKLDDSESKRKSRPTKLSQWWSQIIDKILDPILELENAFLKRSGDIFPSLCLWLSAVLAAGGMHFLLFPQNSLFPLAAWWIAMVLMLFAALSAMLSVRWSKHVPGMLWRSYGNHLYRWMSTSLLPGVACSVAFCWVYADAGCPAQTLAALALPANAFLSWKTMLDAISVDNKLGVEMQIERRRRDALAALGR